MYNFMRYVLAYLTTFGMMLAIVFVMMSSAILIGLGLFSFLFWEMPLITLAGTFLWIRICIITGTIIGIMFIFSKEGQNQIKELME